MGRRRAGARLVFVWPGIDRLSKVDLLGRRELDTESAISRFRARGAPRCGRRVLCFWKLCVRLEARVLGCRRRHLAAGRHSVVRDGLSGRVEVEGEDIRTRWARRSAERRIRRAAPTYDANLELHRAGPSLLQVWRPSDYQRMSNRRDASVNASPQRRKTTCSQVEASTCPKSRESSCINRLSLTR